MNKKTIIFSSTIGFMSLFSCQSNDSIDEAIDNKQEVDTLVENVDPEFFESPDVDYHLPSALQVANIFKKSGMEYNAGITNSTENSINYTSKTQQQLNFGVYSADLAYCIANEHGNEARNYLTVIQDLARDLGMDAVFENKDLIERFEANIENQDSIEYIMIDIHERTQEFMEENDKSNEEAIHYAGAWVEGMYLGVNDYELHTDHEDIGYRIVEQMEILKNIIKGLKDPRNDQSILQSVLTDLEEIQTTFNQFKSVIAYEEDPMATTVELNDEEFKTLSDMVKSSREHIVNPQ